MAKSLLELQNNSMNFRNSKANKRNRDFLAKKDKFFENRQYDAMIQEEEILNKRKNIISESSANSLPQNRKSKRSKFIKAAYQYKNEATMNLFIEGVASICFNSLVLDEDFKNKYEADIKDYYVEQVKSLVESGEISKDIIMEAAPCIKDLYKLCEETADKAKDEILQATKDSIKDTKILSEKDDDKSDDITKEDELNDDTVQEKDVEDLNKNSNNRVLSAARVGTINGSERYVKIPDYLEGDYKKYVNNVLTDVFGIIKDKVVDVIKTEKDNEEIENDLRQEIIANATSGATQDTSLSADPQNKLDVDNTAINDANENQDETRTANDIGNGPSVKVSESFNFGHHSKKTGRTPSLFESIVINTGKKYLSEQAKLVEEGTISEADFNMDLVFAESIIVYTLIESLNTTKLYSLDPFKARTKVLDFIM